MAEIQGGETAKLTALGFCGADDSVDPRELALYCNAYPFIEFGVLFRPDKEGTPRYASKAWVEKLMSISKSMNKSMAGSGQMRLAA